MLLALLRVATACGGGAAVDPDPVVARSGGLEVRTSDVALAIELGDHGELSDIAQELLVDEALAREARELPGAAARATAARRAAGIQRLLAAETAVDEAELRAYFEMNRDEFTRPEEVSLAHIVTDCGHARELTAAIAAGDVEFGIAALKYSRDRTSAVRDGELGWERAGSLDERTQPAVRGLIAPGEVLSDPVQVSDGSCRILRLVARRSARRATFDEAREQLELRARTRARGESRRALIERLGGTGGVTIDRAALVELARGAAVDPARAVVALGDDRITVAEIATVLSGRSAGPGGPDGLAARLAEDLLLWREAVRQGLDQAASVRAAARGALVGELREGILMAVTPALIAPEQLRERYDQSLGDYTEPRRVRVASLVTRDKDKAKRWAAKLAAARAPGDAFERLLAESEDLTAARPGGDMGWIDGRSTHVPDAFKVAALKLARPGAVSGVVGAAGVHHVLLCTDSVKERVPPFEEVEAKIRSALLDGARRSAYEARRAQLRERLQPALDRSALEALRRDAT